MPTVKMLKTEPVATDKGVLTLEAGKVYNLENWIASSVCGRGLATLVEEHTAPIYTQLSELNIGQLRELARDRGIEGYRKLNREDLLTAIGALEIVAGQPKESFEKLDTTGGQAPPVFKRDG